LLLLLLLILLLVLLLHLLILIPVLVLVLVPTQTLRKGSWRLWHMSTRRPSRGGGRSRQTPSSK
jgi:hypothetical protein